ncbi:D-alanyl-D-alanine carboxypeptidase family protein [Thiomicrorhabdus aquaedulcis]|uniref:D-alanyl-D-alanine carboxypeptidase family protein n=1 Tax=Thiomicrorhabdus aquaedulcis TaxID=2211106 RepID=UPI000FDA47BE|nr:D-alanyl-D-alanine carboxypeptidase family protein [Thiomicrorhabdus aquaedulcis]
MTLLKQSLSLVLILFSSLSLANTQPTPDLSNIAMPAVVPTAPSIAGSAYLLMDFNSGNTLAESNVDARVEPASLTKIMTGFVVINELKNGKMSMDDLVNISEKAWKTPGSKMFIEVGKQVPVRDLIKGMVIQSGNDASVALAEHIAGSEDTFAQLMNKYAKTMGMNNTNFVNATGLPHPEHYTTARDLGILTKTLITKHPEEYKWYSERSFTFNGITQHNRNRMLWQDPSVDGLKTGHTDSAGYCLVTSAKRENTRLITVVLGTSSSEQRVEESQKLLNYGFRFFETHKLYSANQRLNEAKVWEGATGLVGLGLLEDLFVTVPTGQYKNLKIETSVDANISAPVMLHQPLGKLFISINDKPLMERPLVALEAVEEGSFFKNYLIS